MGKKEVMPSSINNTAPLGAFTTHAVTPDNDPSISSKSINFCTGIVRDKTSLYTSIFFERDLTLSDKGSIFTINKTNFSSRNSSWDNHIQLLTDGNKECEYFGLHHTAYDHWADIDWIFTNSYAGNGIDFEGYSIDSLLVTIDDIQRIRNGIFYKWDVKWTITAHGSHVPPVPPSGVQVEIKP